MTRYSPSRQYWPAGLTALAMGCVSVWFALQWPPAFIAAVLLFGSAAAVLFLASRPVVEIHADRMMIGRRAIAWSDIRKVDRTGWVSPLAVHLTLADDTRILMVYPGDPDSSNSLLRQVRRGSRGALIDGIPYHQFWGEALPAPAERRQLVSPSYPLLTPEDEAEVERLYQRLKTVGHFDPKNSEEK